MIEQSHQIIKAVDDSLLEMGKTLNDIVLKQLCNATVKSPDFSSLERLNKFLLNIPLSNNPVIYRIACENARQRTHLMQTYRAFSC